MLPYGNYNGKAAGPILWSKSPKAGSDQVVVTMTPTKGEYAGVTADFIGSLEGGAAEITIKALKALGWDGDSDASVTTNEVSFKVYEDNYNGKTTTKVSIFTGVIYTEMSAHDQIAAKSRLKSMLGGVKSAKKATEEEPF
jgi:hypothetical protein